MTCPCRAGDATGPFAHENQLRARGRCSCYCHQDAGDVGELPATFTQPPVRVAVDTSHGPLVDLAIGQCQRELTPAELESARELLEKALCDLDIAFGADVIDKLLPDSSVRKKFREGDAP
ncbi:MAG TPA: hypothetical protein VEL03_18620 [Streptosporangiaceae bacterium]|nr:hypothetical protein [Streptosporangiaceae bacterium]